MLLLAMQRTGRMHRMQECIPAVKLLRRGCNEKREQRCADRQRSGTGSLHDR